MAELVEAILIVQLGKDACVGGVEASLDILIVKRQPPNGHYYMIPLGGSSVPTSVQGSIGVDVG